MRFSYQRHPDGNFHLLPLLLRCQHLGVQSNAERQAGAIGKRQAMRPCRSIERRAERREFAVERNDRDGKTIDKGGDLLHMSAAHDRLLKHLGEVHRRDYRPERAPSTRSAPRSRRIKVINAKASRTTLVTLVLSAAFRQQLL